MKSSSDVLDLPAMASWPESRHLLDKRQRDAVRAAKVAGRPLLVRGDPGTGKSQLAHAAAVLEKRLFLPVVVDSKSEASDLMWRFDAVARLADAHLMARGHIANTLPEQGKSPAERELPTVDLSVECYVHPGPLWWAFNWTTALAQAKKTRIKRANPEQPSGWQPSQGAVLLIDEIDKADSDLPNGLLEALGNGQFGVDLLGETVRRAVDVPPPLVIITTNEERELPAAFLRRCFVLTLTLPTDTGELVKRLLERGEIHFSDLHRKHPKLLEEAAHLLAEDRATAKNAGLYKPGVAEYLDLLRALDQWGGEDPHQTLKDLKEFTFCKQPAI